MTKADQPLTALDYALAAAATARLARLITMDSIFAGPRLAFVRRMDATGHPKLAELAVCPWCISVWVGAVVSIGLHRRWPGIRWVSAALAFSLAAGLANELGSERDD